VRYSSGVAVSRPVTQEMGTQIRRGAPSELVDLSALAYRAKASWGYPAAWLEQWRSDLTLSPIACFPIVRFVDVRRQS